MIGPRVRRPLRVAAEPVGATVAGLIVGGIGDNEEAINSLRTVFARNTAAVLWLPEAADNFKETHRGNGTWILPEVRKIDENAFYVIEQARDISKVIRPVMTPLGGWRAVGKRK